MSSVPASATSAGLRQLLAEPRLEVIPIKGIEQKVAALPLGTTVTVTASPAQGLDRTLDVSTMLAARGYDVVPHLAARMVAGRGHLERIVERLDDAGIREVFVVGGDASPPAGDYAAAGDLLEALSGLSHPFERIGIGAYPEGHPLIDGPELLEALRRKQPLASHLVTQLCFDSDALMNWIRMIRVEGIGLPVVVGLPGVVERRKLAEISLKTGVGTSLRYLRRHARQLGALTRTRRYDPTALAASVAVRAEEPGAGVSGAHLFTFNQVEATWDWVARSS